MTRLLIMIVGVVIVVGGLFLILTRATGEDETALAGLTGDAAAGERVFWASGCASCHHAPDATGEARLVLAGGQRLSSDFGTFAVPNVSPDPEHGIGAWSLAEFASALRRGVSPDGRHYYPAFPYTSYTRMTDQDVADLKAFMDTLPPDSTPNADNEIAFPYSIRRGIAFWKWLNLSDAYVLDGADPAGRYLVEALGHCAECHTPRDAFGGLDTTRWMAGAPNPTGRGQIPDLTPTGLDWSAGDIAYYLETGFTPDFDSAGGHMAGVIANLANLSDTDRAAIAGYLKALPATAPDG